MATVSEHLVADPPSTREQILTEALHRFAEHGYDGTSLADIAGGALYEEVFERLLEDWFKRLVDAIGVAERGWPKVELVLRAGFDFFAENPEYVRLVRREALDGGVHLALDLAAVVRPIFDEAALYLREEMQAGHFRQHDPEQLLLSGYGALLSFFSDAPFIEGLIDADPLAPEQLARRKAHVVGLFRAALVP
jgi:TetR/AcrR family transcriptional regulator